MLGSAGIWYYATDASNVEPPRSNDSRGSREATWSSTPWRTNERALFAIPARRKLPAVHRLRQELRLVVGPERADRGIGLDHRVPQLVLVVAEHLLLLDLLDVDVLDRALGRRIEPDRPARRVELDRRHGLDELDRSRIPALVL